MSWQRLYNFQAGTKINSGQVNGEFNQLIAALNQVQTDDNTKDVNLRKIAQLSKLTKDTGYSFQTADIPNSTSFNDFVNSGNYYVGGGLTEHPYGSSGPNGHLIITAVDTSNILQIWMSVTLNRQFFRTLYGGEWQPWAEVVTDQITTWTNLALSNGATTNNGRTPKFKKIGNLVIVKGEIATKTGIIATLPAGFRPLDYSLTFNTALATSAAGQSSTINVGLDGTINILSNTSTSAITLNGIIFAAEQ